MLNGTRRFGALAIAAALIVGACSSTAATPTAAPITAAPVTAAPVVTAAAASPTAAQSAVASTAPITYTYRCNKGDNKTLNGAGATFPYPLYTKWAADYLVKCGVQVNYQSIGSGGGVKAFTANTVDFGASDAFLLDSEIAGVAKNGVPVEIPVAFGAVVVAYNLKGLSAPLRMTGDIIAGLFDGKITKWNDPAIATANPGVTLPSTDVSIVHRSDGSGTTWIYTNYLSKVSTEWRQRVGAGKSVSWPTGVGGKGNEGVAAFVQKTKGAIGYVEFAYAVENKMTYAALRNQAGAFVEPTSETFQAAAANADWPNAPGFYMVLTDQPGAGSWPITGATFILTYRQQPDANKAAAMLKYFDWCYHHGADVARKLNYVPMPENVIKLVQARWAAEIRAGGRRVWP